VLLALAALLAGPARADEQTAKLHYERATAAYALGHFAEAAEQYEKAFEQKPDPALLFNAAQAHRRAGNREHALALYTSYQQVFPGAPNIEVAARWAQELRTALAAERAAALAPAPTVASAAAPPPARARRRIWWWVAGAAAVASAVALGLALGSRDPREPEPSFGAVNPP
jgi:tetratricopeptide (TPR) repeat protein